MINFLFRLLLIVAGLVFAACLMVAMFVLLIVWLVRALWFKLTGRAVMPFVMRMNPRAGFDQVFRRAERGAADAAPSPRRKLDDVTDVEPKR